MFKIAKSIRSSMRVQKASPEPQEIYEYTKCPDNRITAEKNSLSSTREIKSYQRAISEGDYPQAMVRYNFQRGNTDLPDPENYGEGLFSPGNKPENSVFLANYLHAINELPNYSGNSKLYRGTMVDRAFFEELHAGALLQTHQISFFSESDLVARKFIDSSSNKNKVAILFQLTHKNSPEQRYLKEGIMSTELYSGVKSDLKKLGRSDKDVQGIGSKYKEILVVPGAMFLVNNVSQISSNIHRDKIYKVKLEFYRMSDDVYPRSLF
ncbi:hypothetical protein [Mangrovibacter yixingensis]|uniref:hypothetical protein n=1 Tax=Mangrovibacter yixingensis TaxID=1529639 RepID=UPI001CFEA81D|nr:hypothetical protein [Mangrovibacter yixingensis]